MLHVCLGEAVLEALQAFPAILPHQWHDSSAVLHPGCHCPQRPLH